MKKIDVVTTAVIRPDILEGTFKSFTKYLFKEKDRYRLFINIDRIGDLNQLNNMYKICDKYFNEVHINVTTSPSFPKAVIWLWKRASETDSEFVMHLEDDWKIDRKINIDHMINILNKYKNIACLRLYKKKIKKTRTQKIFGKWYDYNDDGFFLSRDSSDQFGLNPVLIKKEFVKEAAELLIENINPEKQFRVVHNWMKDFILKWEYAIYGKPGDPILVQDTGLNWRKQHGFKKCQNTFITWVKNGIKK